MPFFEATYVCRCHGKDPGKPDKGKLKPAIVCRNRMNE